MVFIGMFVVRNIEAFLVRVGTNTFARRLLEILAHNCSDEGLKEFMATPRKALLPLEIPEVCQ